MYKRDITFAVCCIGSYTTLSILSPEFKSIFQTAAMQALQKATTESPESHHHNANVHKKDHTQTKTYHAAEGEHVVKTVTKTTTTLNGAKNQTIWTTFRSDDIHLTFKPHGPSLIMKYTVYGDKRFLDVFVKELKLNKNRLEIGIKTTISSYLPTADNSIVVKWISMDIGDQDDDLNDVDSTHQLTMFMGELQSLLGIKLRIAEKLLRAQKAKERETLRARVLVKERNALDLIVRAAKDQKNGQQGTSVELEDNVSSMKAKAQRIRDKIQALDDCQQELEDIIADDRYQISLYSTSYHRNEQMVHEFDEKLSLLHNRRITVIGKIKKLVTELQKQMESIHSFIKYLSEKKQSELVGHDESNELSFDRVGNFTFLCNHTAQNYICDQRTIFCKTKLDIFNQSGVSAAIKVDITRPKVLRSDYEIVVMANKQCEQPLLRRDVEIKPVTIHKCKAGDEKCELKSQGLVKIFGDKQTKSMGSICVFIRCDGNDVDTFDVDTSIKVKLKKKDKNDDDEDEDEDEKDDEDAKKEDDEDDEESDGKGDQSLNVKVSNGKKPGSVDDEDENDSGDADEEKEKKDDDEDEEDSDNDDKDKKDDDDDEDEPENGDDDKKKEKKDDDDEDESDKDGDDEEDSEDKDTKKEKKKSTDDSEDNKEDGDEEDEDKEDKEEEEEDEDSKKKGETKTSSSRTVETTTSIISATLFTFGALMTSVFLIFT